MRHFAAIAVFIVVCACATWQFCVVDAAERRSFAQLGRGHSLLFVVPFGDHISAPDSGGVWLHELADEHGVNVFRTLTASDDSGGFTARHYVYVTSASMMLADMQLASGRMPGPRDAAAGVAVATPGATGVGQVSVVGILHDAGRSDDVAILPLAHSFLQHPVAGQYTVEGSEEAVAAFSAGFLERANTVLVQDGLEPLAMADVRPVSQTSHPSSLYPLCDIALTAVSVLFALTVVLQLVVAFRLRELITVMLLHGYSIGSLWYQLVGRGLCWASWAAGVLSLVLLATLGRFSPGQVVVTGSIIAVVAALLVAASYGTMALVTAWLFPGTLTAHQPGKPPMAARNTVRLLFTTTRTTL